MESILTSIKKMLGITAEYTHFDTDLIIHINSVLSTLYQISPLFPRDLMITGADEKWSDLIDEATGIELVKTYVYLKVRLIFDPPTGGVQDAFKQMADELEWRISVAGNV